MRIIQKIQILSLFLFSASFIHAQEQLGLKVDNYSGINGVHLNPSFNTNSPLKWDINLVGAGSFFDNNYAYIQDASLIKILRNENDFVLAPELNGESPATNSLLVDFFDNDKNKSAYLNTVVLGPSFMASFKGHSFGVFTQARAVASSQKIPASLGYYNLESQVLGQEISIDAFDVTAMSWSEVGLNYAGTIFNSETASFSAGFNLRYLMGYEAAFVQNTGRLEVASLAGDSLHFEGSNVVFGLASGMEFDQTGVNGYQLQKNGGGIGFDAGFTYIKKRSGESGYQWKVGASILDAGQIKFKNNTQYHRIDTDLAFDLALDELENVTSEEEFFEVLSLQALLDSDASFQDDNMSVKLPTAFSVQGDVSLSKHFYVNALMVRRMNFRSAMVERANITAITPRFESRWFGVSVPVVLYDDKNLHLGTSLRLGPLTIGSDNLTSIFMDSPQFTGSDFYVALKINPFKINGGGGGKSARSSFGKDGNVKCYKF